jgi:hypothetical protein
MVSTPEHESNPTSLSTQESPTTPPVAKTVAQGQNSTSIENKVDSARAGYPTVEHPRGKPDNESDLDVRTLQMLFEEDGYTSEQLAEMSPEQVQHALQDYKQRQQEILQASLQDLGLNDTVRTDEPEPETARAGPDEEEEMRRLKEEAQLEKNLGDAYVSPKHDAVNMKTSGPDPDFFDMSEDEDNDKYDDEDDDEDDSAQSQDNDDKSTPPEDLDKEDVGHGDEGVVGHNYNQGSRLMDGKGPASDDAKGANMKERGPQAVNGETSVTFKKNMESNNQSDKVTKAYTWAEIVSRGTGT